MKYHKLIKGVFAVLKENMNAEEASVIAKESQKRFLELCEENRDEAEALKKHTVRRIYPVLALYETMLKHGIEKEKAAFYIREYFLRYCAKVVPHMQRIISLFGLAKRMPSVFMKVSAKSFPPEAGFEYEFPQRQQNEARFNIVSCPYMKTCQKYGYTELCTIFCDTDDASYGNMHKDLKWGRTKTIGRGDDCCNFLLEYRKDQ